MDLNLAGKVALVTGGASGVGREIALMLAQEGAAVAINYRRSADAARAIVGEIENGGGKAIARGADVANFEAVKAMIEAVVGEFGRLDILVNNAGVALRQRLARRRRRIGTARSKRAFMGRSIAATPRRHIWRRAEAAAS